MVAMSDTRPGTRAPLVEGAGGVVFNPDGMVLLIRHRKGEWVFPKGHIEDDEDRLETAVREVAEEAGVIARCPDPSATWTTEYMNPRGERREITWFVLATDADRPTMREAQFPEGAFLEPEAALDRLAFDEDRTLLREIVASRS
jgi:diadenosine hexaphosphate hydrolase (ATP-forming)